METFNFCIIIIGIITAIAVYGISSYDIASGLSVIAGLLMIMYFKLITEFKNLR